MANEITQVNQAEMNIVSIGGRLKTTREALGLTRKDVAAQLRLSETVIGMMEDNQYPSDLPSTFIRGYLRSYGKLINIPEDEMQAAIEPIKPTTPPVEQEVIAKPIRLTSSNYFMQISTYLIVATVVSLAGVWWYNHGSPSTSTISTSIGDSTQAENQTKPIPLPGISSTIDENTDIAPENLAQSLNTDPQLQPPALLAASSETNQQPITTTPAPSSPTNPAKPEEHKVVADNHPHATAKNMRHDDDDQDEEETHVRRNPGF